MEGEDDRSGPPAAPSQENDAPIQVLPTGSPFSSSQASHSASVDAQLQSIRAKMESAGEKEKWNQVADIARKAEEIFAKKISDLEDFIPELNVSKCAAGCVVALKCLLEWNINKKNDDAAIRTILLVKQMMDTGSVRKHHIVAVIDIYAGLFCRITDILIKKAEFANGLLLLKSAIDVLVDKSDQTVTSLHGLYFTLCLKAHAINPGLEYIYPYIRAVLDESPSGNSASNNSSIDSRSLLTYLYYGALLLARTSNWKRAAILLDMAVSVPGMAVSEVQIEALKKLYIISLMKNGEVNVTNKSSALAKAWKNAGMVYVQLANAVENAGKKEDIGGQEKKDLDAWSAASNVFRLQQRTFDKDGNSDLVRLLIHELKLKAVLRVAKLYNVISIQKLICLANLSGAEETSVLLKTLVCSSRLLVSEERDGFLRLYFPSKRVYVKTIEERHDRLRGIGEDLERLDVAAQLTPFYLQRQLIHDDEGLSMSNAPEAVGTSSMRKGWTESSLPTPAFPVP